MNLETQIRRTLASFAVLIAFGTVAAVHGESIDAVQPQLDATSATAEACASTDVLQANEVDVALPDVEIAPTAVRLDWRAHLPASIARSRT
jgi:hypothetical protein